MEYNLSAKTVGHDAFKASTSNTGFYCKKQLID